MAKQLNVNLAFSADTSKVKVQLQDLQNQLNKLTLSSKTELGITKDIEDASRAAAELSVHLKNATNQQTGTLDFSKLNQSIKQSGTSLQQYGRTLQSLGPQGQQAFMSLAQAVANSEVPIRRTNAMLKEMGTTLANTARWQLSSSMLHGFMGAVQSAYGYAQDLNESLNNIRIVTGQNIDQMAKFAEKANKAARALSTTTTEYTNASLIYYQQGLNDQQVKERTDITIKMANVARQSAEVVSDQMTAVWNNFYDGSKSLEHYADVMTALGAATASSTDEIAEGLNKFAAVADTVGLSYEYAASALATVTATTRQSADVVGTAFKTLFARIQDLELGKTLDDGTTLGSYSQALAKVGVQIKDTSGEMKSMDAILEEMSAKWDTLGKAEQIALAQSVAGVRQYTQLIALMDNWDFMEKNLATSNTSSGALQKQADIYAESWEAARDRVRAAAEGVYKSLINDEFFIDVLNNIEKIISFVDHLIDNLGGLKGVLMAVGAIATKVFSAQLSQGLTNMVYNIRMMTKAGREAEQNARKKIIDDAIEGIPQSKEYSSKAEKAEKESMRSQLTLQQEMMANADRMNAIEQARNQMLLDRNKVLQEQAILAAKAEDAAIQQKGQAVDVVQTRVAANFGNDQQFQLEILRKITAETGKMKESFRSHSEIDALFTAFKQGGEASKESVKQLQNQIIELKSGNPAVQALIDAMKDYDLTVDNVEENITTLKAQIKALITDSAATLKADIIPEEQMQEGSIEIDNLVNSIEKQIQAEIRRKNAVEDGTKAHKAASQAIQDSTGNQKQWADIIVESANFAFSAASALQMLGGAFEQLRDPDVSGWQKFLTVLTTLGMIVPTVISLFSTLKKLLSAETVAKLANVAASLAQAAAERQVAKAKEESSTATKQNTSETNKNTASKVVNKVADSGKGGKSSGKFGNLKNAWNQGALDKDKRFTKLDDGRYRFKGSKQTFSADVAGKKAGGDLFAKVKNVGAGFAWITAGVTVAVEAVKWGIAQYNKQAEAAKKAAEMSKEAASAYESVAEANNKFVDSVSAYESAQKSLEGMTKGTADYEAAVLKANDAAIALLDTYKDLTYTVDGNGLILIDEASLEQAKKSQLDILQNAQMSKQIAAQNVRDKELAAEMTQFERDKLHSSEGFLFGAGNAAVATGVGAGSGALIGTGLGTVIGTVLPGLGNIIGAGVGAAVGAIAGAIVGVIGSATAGAASGEEERALWALAEEYANSGSAAFASDEALRDLLKNKLKIDDEALINSLVANRESTLELAQAMAANTAQIEAQNIALVQQELGDVIKNSNLSQENQQNLTEVMGRSLDHLADDLYEEIYKDQAGGLTDKEIQKQYAEAMGWDVEKTENKNGNKATYYDKDGNVVAEDLSDEIARRYLAQAKALQNLETSSKKLIDTFNRLDQSLNNYDHAFKDFLGDKNFMESGYDEVNALIQEVGVGGVVTKGTVARYLDEQLGDGKDGKISDETANAWGYANAEAFYNSFYTALISYNDKWEDIASGVTNYAADTFNNFSDEIKGSMSQKQASAFVNDINEARLKHGTEGADIIASLYQKAGKEAGKLAEALDGVDWDTISIQELATTIDVAGITTKYTATELGTSINMMEDSSNSITNLQKLAKLIKELNTLQQGDTINVEQFNQLSTEMQSYFTLMSDGTYKLTQDALDFYQLTQNSYKIQAEYAIRKLTAEQENIVRLYNMKEDKGAKYFTQDYVEPKEHSENRYLLDTSVAWGMYGDWGLGYTGKTYEEYVQMYGPSGAKVTNGKADMTGVSNIHDDRGMGQDGKYTILIKPEVDDSDPTAPIDGPTDYIFYGSEDAWRKNLLIPAGSDSYDAYNNNNKQLIQDQIDILKHSEWGKTTEGQSQLTDWQDAFDKGLFSDEMAYYLAEKVDANINSAFDNLGTSMTEIDVALQEAMDGRAMAATSYKEREELLELGPANGGINLEAYNKAAEAAINQERWEDLDVAQVAEYAEYLEDAFDMSEEGAEEAARVIMKMNKGIESLSNGFEDWSDILEKSSEDSYEYFEAMNGIKTSLSDILDVSEEFISNDFVKTHMEDIEKAAKGDEKAIDDLKKALADQIILDMFEVDSLDQLSTDLQSKITTLKDWIDKNPLKIGATIDTASMSTDEAAFLQSCQEVIAAAGMTAEQANAYFSQMGYSTEFETEPQLVKQTGYETITQSEPMKERTVNTPDGGTITYPSGTVTKTFQGAPYEYNAYVDAIKMQTVTVDGKKTKVPKIKSISKTPTGSSNNFSSSNVGVSSTKKAKPIKRTKKTDVVERYKEVTDKIDDVQNAMNDASKAADRLWGPARLKQLEKQNELIQDEVKLLKQKKKEAQANLIKDRSDLSKAAAAAGVSFNIDEKGNITNYTEKMNALYAELESRENEANGFVKAGKSKEEQDEYIEKYVTPLQNKINKLKDAISQYDETRELLEDIDDQIDDKWNKWQDNNYEQLTYKLELNLELNDMELEDIEYELNKIADDFYKMAEAAALMVDSSSSSTSTSYLDIYAAELKSYEDQQIALNEAFEKGEISQSSYVEGLKEVKSGIYENLQAIQELDKSMTDYYGNTLDMAADEIAKYTDRMDHQVSVLDHYSSLLEIMGKQNDYKTMHKTLEAKAQIIGDQVAVAKDTLEMYQGQAEARFNEYQDALARGDGKAAELYLKQYEAALAAANEAQDVYLSKAEEWAEALKAVLENKLADIGKTLEEALTGGTSFDEISKQMERASSLQEEYLTTTNKIYETNKMINTAQQAIDKTDNLNAKRRLRSFQEETAQMQNKGKLSKFELEIQQAKYDLLLAEIALEEAQNAKSMVRLQRDSEGNFGYVYTADDQKVAEAEQNAMNKENALYNIRLEGANSYVEKYQQTMQEMYDELQDLTDRYHNGEIESFEEYQRLMTETQNHYYQKLEDYSELYGIAIQEDTRIIEEAWSTEFASMTENTEEWKKNVDIYIGEVSTAFDNYEKEMERIALETGTDMASMENSIKEVVDESKNLKDALVGENGLISAINDQATAVANITSRYASLRDSLGLIIAAYEASGKAAGDAIIKQQEALQAINTTNTALDNQAGTVGEDGSLTEGGGEGGKNDGGGKGPEDLEPSLIEPPKDFEVTVIPRLSHPRETESIRASRIIISDQPTSGSTDPNQMIRVIYNDGLMGNITRKDYDAIKQYQIDLEKYNKTIASMDTGGYTGSWGTEGKLAMLHQKELVLNADDTQNFLTSLDVLHEIIKMIDLQAINSRVGGFLQIPNMNFAPNEILEQQVRIEASFPGVTDRNEIEEAFKTLVNRASQFANRKNF